MSFLAEFLAKNYLLAMAMLLSSMVENAHAQIVQDQGVDGKGVSVVQAKVSDWWTHVPVVWNEEPTNDGLLVGVRMRPKDGVLPLGQPLVIQYVLKNCGDQAIELSLSAPVREFMLNLHSGNKVTLAGIKRTAEEFPIRLASGEVLDDGSWRTSICTNGLTQGEYVLPKLPVFAVRNPKMRNIGYTQEILFRIEDPVVLQQPQAESKSGFSDLGTAWGEPIAGFQLGAKLVRLEGENYVDKSGRFHEGETMELQLSIRNNTARARSMEIYQPPDGRTWPLHVKDQKGAALTVQVPASMSYSYHPRIRLELAPRESRGFTSIPVKTASHRGDSDELTIFGETTLRNAKLSLLSTSFPGVYKENESVQVAIGKYSVQVEVKAKPLGSDFYLVLESGSVPFRIEKNPFGGQ